MSNVQEVNREQPHAHAALRSVLLRRPDAHPLWHTYLLSLVHLRQVTGWLKPQLAFPDSTHEIAILALDARYEADPNAPETIHVLMPPNLAYQLRGKSDAVALSMFGGFVQALSSGELSPDTDHRRCQVAWLERWGQSS